MCRKILALSFLFISVRMNAQQLINDKIDIIAGSGVYKINAVIYLPRNYSSGTSYPLVIYAHGVAQAGSDISKMYVTGLPRVLQNGYIPPFDFIMIAPQHGSFGPDPAWLPGILEDANSRWKIDNSRIYVTGNSAGGWMAYGSQMNVSTTVAQKIAAIVPVSGATQDINKNNFSWFATSKTPVWAIVGELDPSYRDQNIYMVNEINKQVANLAFLTIRPGEGHGNWDPIYNGTLSANGKNIWSWMYQFTKGASSTPPPASPPPPPPTSGAGQLINDKIDVVAGSGVYNTNAVIYLPPNYSTSTSYPLVIYCHGSQEAGSDINRLYASGTLPQILKGGYVPSFNFIMVAAQRSSYSIDPNWLTAIIEESQKRWNINLSRIYVIGHDAGGWGVYGSQMNVDQTLANTIAAIAVTSGVTQDVNKNNFGWFSTSKTPVWAIVGSSDVTYREQNSYMVNEINKRVPNLASITVRSGIGHNAWSEVYNGMVKNSAGKNIWEWLYQFTN
ncbi:MAG: hypothetical protein J7502_03195 [Flavisolibacter sp.]|nr:hypothetical protein [Flavisolibacter sp.]